MNIAAALALFVLYRKHWMINLNKQVLEIYNRGQKDYNWFIVKFLGLKDEWLWSKMREINDSVIHNERTVVPAGHGVSKTFNLAHLCLAFLLTHRPSTVISTAPSQTQVEDLLWREIHQAYSKSKVPIGGKLTSTELDFQPETGLKWFATGFSTRPDTVTTEATKMQGYHNDNMLIIIDEAAGVLPEIWRATEHIGAPSKRVIAVGNATSGTGDFAEAIRSGDWHCIKVSVKDTPNYIQSKQIIPGVYGRDYEKRIRLKYGEDSDEYAVRVMGEVSRKKALGSYYAYIIEKLRSQGRICEVIHNPHYNVNIVLDTGYTTAIWFYQEIDCDVHFIRYYEDSGVGVEGYARLFDSYRQDLGYKYGHIFVPCDMDSNATKVITGDTTLTTLRNLGYYAEPLKKERSVEEGIQRTSKFLVTCKFDKDLCKYGLERAENYHERVNKRLSTEDKPIFTGEPEKDGNDHAADGLRYASKAVGRSSGSAGERSKYRELKEMYA